MFYIKGQEIDHEVIPYNNGKKVIIYLEKREESFIRTGKCFGTHYLEQIFDKNNELLTESIKENPHFVNLDNFSDNLDFD